MNLRAVSLGILLAWALQGVASGPFQHRVVSTSLEEGLAWLDSIPPEAGLGENARLVSSGLAVLLGPFGAHRLYLGTTPKVAIIYGLTFGGFGVLVLLDLGHLLFTKDLGAYRKSDRVFMWGKPDGNGDAPPIPR